MGWFNLGLFRQVQVKSEGKCLPSRLVGRILVLLTWADHPCTLLRLSAISLYWWKYHSLTQVDSSTQVSALGIRKVSSGNHSRTLARIE